MIALWIILIIFSVIVIVVVLQLTHNNKNKTPSANSSGNQFHTRPGYVRIDIEYFTSEYNSAIPQDKFIMLQKMIMQGCKYAEIPKSDYNAIIAKRKEVDKIINPTK